MLVLLFLLLFAKCADLLFAAAAFEAAAVASFGAAAVASFGAAALRAAAVASFGAAFFLISGKKSLQEPKSGEALSKESSLEEQLEKPMESLTQNLFNIFEKEEKKIVYNFLTSLDRGKTETAMKYYSQELAKNKLKMFRAELQL